MDRKKKHQLYQRDWIAAKRLAAKLGSPTNNVTYTDSDSDSNDPADKYTNMIETLKPGQDMFMENVLPHSTESGVSGETSKSGQNMFVETPNNTESGVSGETSRINTESGGGGDDETWNIIDENPVVSSDSVSSDEEGNIASDLVSWINKHQIKHNAADDLLKFLKTHGHNTLPLSARTLLKTDRTVQIEEKSGMSYIYLGLEEALVRTFEKYPPETKQSTINIELSLNVDGLPLFKSSNTCMWPVADGFATSSQESSPKVPRKLQEKHVFNKGTSSDGPHDAASSSGSADPGPKRPAAASEAEHADRPLRTILAQLMTRMKSVDENVQMLLNIQQSRESREDVEDVLPAPVSSPEELADLCTKLADKSFKNKLTQYLSSLGGHSLGDTVRRIFRKLGTNSVWSAYSLKGKKRKQAFADLPLCKVIIRACLKTYAKAKISEVETEISEALKHAPKRKGGSRYKEPEPKRRQTSVQESSDSDD